MENNTLLNTYDIYQRNNDIKAIKNGFSWVGFFCTWTWAFFTRQWQLGILGLLLTAFYNSIIKYISIKFFGFVPEELFSFKHLGNTIIIDLAYIIPIGMLFGLKGNKWLSSSLKKNGYEKKNTINAETKKTAIDIYKNRL